MEATPRFELGNKGFADLCLTTWLCRHLFSAFPTSQESWLKLARVEGFEPSHDGIRISCLTAWRYPNIMHYLINGVDGGIRTHVCWNHNPVS